MEYNRLKARDGIGIIVLAGLICFIVNLVAKHFTNLDGKFMLLWLTILQDFIFIGMIAFYLKCRRKKQWCDIGVRAIDGRTAAESMVWGVGVFVFMVVAFQAMNMILPNGVPQQNVESFFTLFSPKTSFIVSMLIMAVLAPIAEELLFRGYIYHALLDKMNSNASMLVTSLTFACIHGDVYRFIPLAIGGYALNYLSVKKQSLLASMIMHGVWNATMVAMVFLTINER